MLSLIIIQSKMTEHTHNNDRKSQYINLRERSQKPFKDQSVGLVTESDEDQ